MTVLSKTRAKAARKPAAKKMAAKPAPKKKKVDARTRRFLDALLGLKL